MFADVYLYTGVALAGFVSFASPCVLPLVPPYLLYVGSILTQQMTGDVGATAQAWRRTVLASVVFGLGFATVFVALGAGASAAGQLIGQYKSELAMASGVVILLLGLYVMVYRKVPIAPLSSSASLMSSYVIGLAFAFGWTPCVGPVLAAVLAVAARDDSQAAGVKLLLAYALGLGLAFVLAAIALRPLLGLIPMLHRHLGRVETGMGALLVITGLLFLTGSMNGLGEWLLDTFPVLGQLEDATTPQSLRHDILTSSVVR